ncbi:YHS domain-containing (seleno)protein [Roseibium sp. HPY-6]|uniref:YHS domain-containing (seleno)protein n=1 Tax=Roseibium sp. HPY-6 TaxID=3229852 RepID=UPI00338E9351
MKSWPEKKTWMCLSVTLSALLCVFAGIGHARPQLFVPDPITGYAIGGNDPVSYFVDRRPRKGDRRHELTWGGAEWVFVNEGNRAAFERNPETYAPLFAGCGGFALSEGFATAGSPFIYAMVEGRLVFFHSVVNRFLFVVNGPQLVKDAEANASRVGCIPES